MSDRPTGPDDEDERVRCDGCHRSFHNYEVEYSSRSHEWFCSSCNEEE